MAAGSSKEPARGTYQHFKGGYYEVLGIADEPESGKRFVVYRSLGLMENLLAPDPENEFASAARIVTTSIKGELAVCTVARFTELVDGKEFHNGKRVPRFRPAEHPPGV